MNMFTNCIISKEDKNKRKRGPFKKSGGFYFIFAPFCLTFPIRPVDLVTGLPSPFKVAEKS